MASILLVVALVASTSYVIWTIRRSFPQLDGEAFVPRLTSAVQVIRDEWGVPQIYADNAEDLFRAQGYVHAQDRFWEMDMRRRITAGRLAEIFGEDLVETDRVVRTLGWRRTAEAELALLSPETRRYLELYAEGVNAYLADHEGGRLSLEYAVLSLVGKGYTPEPWTATDSLAWLKALAWDLRTNVEDEIERALLAARLPPHRVEQLYPRYPYDRHPTIVRGGAVVEGRFQQREAADTEIPWEARDSLEGIAEMLDDLPPVIGGSGEGAGSNSWVVDGSRTTSGQPLLANDPHLAPSMPSVWYQMGLHCREVSKACPFDVAGYTFAGVPGVIIGHNDRIAWGLTNLGADVTDLYLERVSGDQYLHGGQMQPLEVRQETIEVAGADPVQITIRSTRHGPLLSDVVDEYRDVGASAPVPGEPASPGEAEGESADDAQTGSDQGQQEERERLAVALQWTALSPGRTGDAIFILNRARGWKDFRTAAELLEVPSQNMVYADVDGNIGYQAPGRVPIRGAGDGRWPAPGWDPEYDWQGFIPFEELPTVRNPEEGFIVTANNAVTDASYRYPLTEDWAYGYRASRISGLLEDRGDLDVEAMRAIQMDSYNPNAAVLVPLLLDLEVDSFTQQAVDLLKGWDFSQPSDSAPAAYFNAVWRNVLDLTFHDEFPDVAPKPSGGGRWFEVMSGLVKEPESRWWDDVRTEDHRETRDDILATALHDARYELTSRMGKDPGRWRWGRLHTLTLEHATLGSAGPGPVRSLFNRGPLEVGGGSSLVNATGWDAGEGYEVTLVPSMRMVVDLGDLDSSRWVNLTGASGHAYNSHYDDQAELWREGRTLPWRFSRDAVDAGAADRLTLRPEPGAADRRAPE